MVIEIDQSGKIEETHRDTVLAFSNGKSYSIRIKAKTKRQLQKLFRDLNRPRFFVIYIFTYGIYFLIKDFLSEIGQINIDIEYPSKEQWTLDLLDCIFKEKQINQHPVINFKLIGRRSKAHLISIYSSRNKKAKDKIISFDDFNKMIIKNKNRRPVLKHIVERLK